MKKRYQNGIMNLVLLLIFMILSASKCVDNFRFKEPQPKDTKNRSEFPKSIQGEYNPEYRDFIWWDYPDIKEFCDTISACLELPLHAIDSNILIISDRSIIRNETEGILLQTVNFGDYIKILHSLNSIDALKSIFTTNLMMEEFGMSIISIQDGSMTCDFEGDTVEFLFHGDTISLFMIDHSMEAEIFFGKSNIDLYSRDTSSTFELHLTDTSVLAYSDDTISFQAIINDSTFWTIENNDTVKLFWSTRDSLYYKSGKVIESVPVIDGFFHILDSSTERIFNISSTSLLRRFKRSYYLNKLVNRKDSCQWKVSQLHLEKDVLSISKICESEAMLERISGICKINKVKLEKGWYYCMDPSKSEFRKLVKAGAFSNSEYFEKLKTDHKD